MNGKEGKCTNYESTSPLKREGDLNNIGKYLFKIRCKWEIEVSKMQILMETRVEWNGTLR